MKALIGRKIGMTQIFGEKGRLIPVTLIQAEACTLAGMRTRAKDGYDAAIIGYGEAKHPGKSRQNLFKNLKTIPAHVKEISLGKISATQEPEAEVEDTSQPVEAELPKVGDTLDVSMFSAGDEVTISGTSKGKGFAGTIKRHNFHRGPKTHGSHSYRALGSIGSMYPQKVYKGRKMAGRMGQDKVTIKQVSVAEVDASANLLALKGAIPGSRKSIVVIVGA